MNVADAMTPRDSLVTAVVPGTREDVLDRLQDNEFSSIPVVNDDSGEFRGLVSRERLMAEPDENQVALLVEEVESVAADATAAELMTERVNTTFRETPLTVAERELAYAGEAYGLVLDDSARPTGMLTEVDVLDVARIVEGEESTGDAIADEDDDWKWEGIKAVGARYLPTRNVELPAEPVAEFMTDSLVTVGRSKPATDIARLFVTEDIEQAPVMSGDEVVGVVRDTDLLDALV